MEIDGDLVQPSNVVTKLKSKNGLLDNAKGELELYDGIEIDASNGMTRPHVARHGLLQGAPRRLQGAGAR